MLVLGTIGVPSGIAVDATDVFFSSGEYIYHSPLVATTTPNKTLFDSQNAITALTASPSTLFYTRYHYGPDGGDIGAAASVTKDGQHRLVISPTSWSPREVRTCGQAICWIDGFQFPSNIFECSAAPSGCDAPSSFFSTPWPWPLESIDWDGDNSRVYFADALGLHWAKFGIGTTDVMAEPGVKVLRYSPVTKRIYWIVEFSNLSGLFSCDPTKCTTTVVEMMPRAPRLLGRIALDSTHVYFTDKRAVSGGVYRCPLAGCDAAPEVLATPQAGPTNVAVSDQVVAWVDELAEPTASYVVWVAK